MFVFIYDFFMDANTFMGTVAVVAVFAGFTLLMVAE
jgi:hypothetical protein